MELTDKQKTFSPFFFFFFAFLKFILNSEHLPKKNDPRSRRISGNTGSEKYG